MRDPDVRKFLLCAAGIVVVFWTIGYGIPAAVILAVPEPLPDLAPQTADSIWLSWDLHREAGQADMYNQLQRLADAIELEALLEVGINPFGANAATGCGRYQLDVEPDGRYELRTANTGESHSTGGGIGP